MNECRSGTRLQGYKFCWSHAFKLIEKLAHLFQGLQMNKYFPRKSPYSPQQF